MKKRWLIISCVGILLGNLAWAQVATPDKKNDPIQRPASLDEAAKAQTALEEILRAYESGNVGLFQSKLDPSMIGYQHLLDGIIKDLNSQKRVRINLTDTQVMAGPDVAVIQTRWEKRFISTGFAANLFTGQTAFLMHKSQAGWRVSSINGDSLFASQSTGVLAQITFNPGALSTTLIPTWNPPCDATPTPGRIEIVDPDMTDRSSISIEMTTSVGDRETFTVPAIAPGRFALSRLPILLDTGRGAPFTAGNGCVDINTGSTFPITVTVSYTDNNPGNNRPTSVRVSKSITVVP